LSLHTVLVPLLVRPWRRDRVEINALSNEAIASQSQPTLPKIYYYKIWWSLIDIACVSEPASVPHNPSWFSNADGLVAIYIGAKNLRGRCALIKAGSNFVVVKCDDYYLFSIYIAPSVHGAVFHSTLDELRELSAVRTAVGSSPTCVRDNGSSIIDLTWSSADVCRLLADLRVLSDAVSLSDHRYIAFRIGDTCRGHTGRYVRYPTWNAKRDRDLFVETLDWLNVGDFPRDSVEALSSHITRMVSTACDVSAKRLRFHNTRRGVYWWNDDLAQARR